MKKILFLSVLFFVFLATNSFALYVDVYQPYEADQTPTNITIGGTNYPQVWTGAFELTFTVENSTPYNSFGFCIDIYKDAGSGPAHFDSVTNNNIFKQIAWVLDTYWDTNNAWEKNSGIQLAIWELLYDNSFATLPKSEDGDQYDWFATIMGSVPGDVSGIDTSVYRIVDFDGELQDMITTNPVPEPATMALFGLGLLGISLVGRKRR